MRTVVLRVVALALLLLLALVAVITVRTLQGVPDTIVYFVRDRGTTFTLEAAHRRLGASDARTRVERQVAELARGPTADEAARGLGSAVPGDVVVLDVRLDDGVVTVDLNAAFERGGGSASMMGRLYQLYYTLTQPSDVDAVRLAVEGRVIDLFGGEGVVLEVPWSRAQHPDLPIW